MVVRSDADRFAELRKDRPPAITRDSVVEGTADYLRELIIEGRYEPDDKIPDKLASEVLGVARGTHREACRLLVHERLLDQQLNRGFFVRRPTRADLVDVFRVRRLIELAAVREPAVSTADGNRLLEAVTEGERAVDAGDWDRVGTANMWFHRAVAGLLGSDRVDLQMRQVLAELRLVFHAMRDARRFYEPYLPRNRAITDRLLAGEPMVAHELLRTYLNDAERQLLDAYSG